MSGKKTIPEVHDHIIESFVCGILSSYKRSTLKAKKDRGVEEWNMKRGNNR